MNEEIYENIVKSNDWKAVVEKLSYIKHKSFSDAEGYMLPYMYKLVQKYHKKTGCTFVEFSEIIKHNSNPKHRNFVNYVIYNSYNSALRELAFIEDHSLSKHGYSLKINIVNYVDEIIKPENNLSNINYKYVSDVCFKCLKKQTAEFSMFLLLNGEIETKSFYGYNTSKLNQRIKNISKIMDKKRESVDLKMYSSQYKKGKKTYDVLKKLIDYLEKDSSYSDSQFGELVISNINNNLLNNIVSDNYVYPIPDLQKFGNNGQDDYNFVNQLYREFERIKSEYE